jgi:hypothetical protein
MQAALQSYNIFSNPSTYPPTTTTVAATYLVSAVPRNIAGILYDPFVANGTTEYNYLRSSNGKYFVAYSVGLNGTTSSTAISTAGVVTRVDADDICVTNGSGCDPGVLNCYAGYTKCSGACVDLQNDSANCGSCGNACSVGISCVGGSCGVVVGGPIVED